MFPTSWEDTGSTHPNKVSSGAKQKKILGKGEAHSLTLPPQCSLFRAGQVGRARFQHPISPSLLFSASSLTPFFLQSLRSWRGWRGCFFFFQEGMGLSKRERRQRVFGWTPLPPPLQPPSGETEELFVDDRKIDADRGRRGGMEDPPPPPLLHHAHKRGEGEGRRRAREGCREGRGGEERRNAPASFFLSFHFCCPSSRGREGGRKGGNGPHAWIWLGWDWDWEGGAVRTELRTKGRV